VERWIEIHDATGRLVTVIEVLSKANKQDEPSRKLYQNKRHTLMSAGVNLVEIDLVREGGCVFAPEICESAREQGAAYAVCVFRAIKPQERECYFIGLRQPLPVVSIPLRATDADVVLELQPLIDQCHERGRYHRLNYRAELYPPFTPDDTAWVDAVLHEKQLR
jgi:hypothetical protein